MKTASYPNDAEWSEARGFVERRLASFPSEALEDLNLTLDYTRTRGRRHWWTANHQPPKPRARKDRRHFVKAEIGDAVRYPLEVTSAVGSEQIDRLAAKLMDLSKPWEYLYDREVAVDKQELMVLAAGWGLWWYLRKKGLVGGRATRTDAMKNAYDWLRIFKTGRGTPVSPPQRLRRRETPDGSVGFVLGIK